MPASAQVIERSQDLRFAGALDDRDREVGQGRVDSAIHGVLLKVWARVSKARVEDVRFKVFGCTTSIACTAWLAERARGLAIDEVRQIEPRTISEALALDEQKTYAAHLAVEAMSAALADQESKSHG